MVEMECIDKGFNNDCVFSFIIGGLREEDFKIHIVIPEGVTEDPRDSRRVWSATTSPIGKDKQCHSEKMRLSIERRRKNSDN